MSSFKFLDKLPSELFSWNKDPTRPKNLRITYGKDNDAIKEPVSCDVVAFDSSFPEFLLLQKYSILVDGVRFATPNVLAAMKVYTVGDRGLRAGKKKDTDVSDVQQMLSCMERRKEKMPQDIIDHFLTAGCLKKFQEEAAKDELDLVWEWLTYVGVEPKTILSNAESAVSHICVWSVPHPSSSCCC